MATANQLINLLQLYIEWTVLEYCANRTTDVFLNINVVIESFYFSLLSEYSNCLYIHRGL